MTPFHKAQESFEQYCKSAKTICPEICEARTKIWKLSHKRGFHFVVHLTGHTGQMVAIYEVFGQYEDALMTRRVYTEEEVKSFSKTIETANSLWCQRAEEYRQSGESDGSAVCGAGIAIRTLFPRERKPQTRKILTAPYVMQGSLSWESSLSEILAFLEANGIECHYVEGWLA